MTKKKNYKQLVAWLTDTLESDLRVCKRVVNNYRKGRADVSYGKVGISEFLEHYYQAGYIEFLLEDVLTGKIYKL